VIWISTVWDLLTARLARSISPGPAPPTADGLARREWRKIDGIEQLEIEISLHVCGGRKLDLDGAGSAGR
jgi:hypothetical protein